MLFCVCGTVMSFHPFAGPRLFSFFPRRMFCSSSNPFPPPTMHAEPWYAHPHVRAHTHTHTHTHHDHLSLPTSLRDDPQGDGADQRPVCGHEPAEL
jgi:hypothetical protein